MGTGSNDAEDNPNNDAEDNPNNEGEVGDDKPAKVQQTNQDNESNKVATDS